MKWHADISKSILLLLFGLGHLLRCSTPWSVGDRTGPCPFEANGSMIKGPDGKIVGSRLIAQPFTKDEYFQPRPSSPSYDASASASSSLAVSNYALRDRVAHTLGPIVTYKSGPEAGKPAGPT